jgi:hypothetical protein
MKLREPIEIDRKNCKSDKSDQDNRTTIRPVRENIEPEVETFFLFPWPDPTRDLPQRE